MSCTTIPENELRTHTCPTCAKVGTILQATPENENDHVVQWYVCRQQNCTWQGPAERLAAFAEALASRTPDQQLALDVRAMLAEDEDKGERKSSGDSCKRQEKPGDKLRGARPDQEAWVGGSMDAVGAQISGENKTTELKVRCSPSQKILFELAAEQSGKKLSRWVIDVLTAAARESILADPLKFSVLVDQANSETDSQNA